MSDTLRLSALQMCTGDDVEANLNAVATAAAQAGQRDVRLMLLPENVFFLGRNERDKLALAEDFGQGPLQARCAELAREHGLFLVVGSLPLRCAGETERVWQASLVYGPDGQCIARYDKLHLFDVDLADGTRYRESRRLLPGENDPVLFDCDGVPVGLSICYDLRFPELYRALSAQGAQVLLVPSAFTAATGRAHWDTLLRARAVENLAAVVGSNQCGTHPNDWRSWGHSMILGPWGETLAQAGPDPELIVADLNTEALALRRQQFPVLTHRRL